MMKRNMIIAIIVTFCFTATLLMAIPIKSANSPYNPWLDYNDDGKIGLSDLVTLANSYGTTGDPINKTELLIQVNATYAGLLSEIDGLNSSLLSLQTELAQMNATISQLSNSVDILNMTKLGKPDYDTKWTNITAGQQITFNHNLGTTNVLVYLIGNDTSGTLYIHQIKYGMDDNFGYEYGARWQELTSTSIKVIRGASDPNWNQIRLMMWKIPT